MRWIVSLAVVVVVLGWGQVAQAALLIPSYETQLETWLGQGNLDFTNIYTKAGGDTSTAFHSAADGQGTTFSLFEVTYTDPMSGEAPTAVIGGYNPQSWSSIDGWHFTTPDALRVAFIYNLTTGVQQKQRLQTDPLDSTIGKDQTYNVPNYGPTFGGGHDIFVNSNLSSGSALQYSYGAGLQCTWGGVNILGFDLYVTPCNTDNGNDIDFTVGALEVYTFAQAPVVAPEPTTLLLLGTGLAAVVYRRRRKMRS